MAPIRVLIAEDHPVFRAGIIHAINHQPDMETVGQAENGMQAVELTHRLQPDVILMDLHMPIMDGITAAEQISAAFPQVAILMLTIERDDDHIFKAIKAGARGYLLKDADETILTNAIMAAARGEGILDSKIAIQVLREFRRMSEAQPQSATIAHLTDTECDILKRLAQGDENHTIAEFLHLSEKTVVNRLTIIYQKLHVNNRTQAALYALRNGLAPVPNDK